MSTHLRTPLLAVLPLACALPACASLDPDPSPSGSASSELYASYADTTVCVVDRTAPTGLRELPAKRDPGGRVVLLTGGEIAPLAEVHPVGIAAGYAGREAWFTSREPITHAGRRYVPYEDVRRVGSELLRRAGEHRGIPVYSDPDDDSPPQAIYVPTGPGCLFQAYVREDLLE